MGRNQNQPAIMHFAPTADVALAEFHEKDGPVMIAMPIDHRNFFLPGINPDKSFWVIDPETRTATYVNPAYEAITGRSCQSLIEKPSSYEKAIHPDDRAHVLGELKQAAQSGHFNEKFRIVRPEGEVRWVWVRGFPVRDPDGKVTRLVGTALEITPEKEAEERVVQNLALARSAWAEADALRKATMGLTQ